MSNVIGMYSNLTPQQARFATWIDKELPFLANLFDFDKGEYLPDMVGSYLGTASHGQAIMARFALGVWRHDNDFKFDAIEAARTLDAELMAVITAWMERPFRP